VNIGRVVSVNLDYDPKTKNFPSVVGAVIYPDRLGKAHEKLLKEMGTEDDARSAQLMAAFVKQGLRAQARSANLITGQLYISLSFLPNAAPVAFDMAARPLRIPCLAAWTKCRNNCRAWSTRSASCRSTRSLPTSMAA
jgi:paraquat-inducible protein B